MTERTASVVEVGAVIPELARGGGRTGVGSGALSNSYRTEYAPLFAHSAKMRGIRALVEEVAETTATVFIRGESGVGKDLVARAVHAASPRHAGPFVKVNCAALPSELLESELFGHEKGAFTGAHRRKPGQFEYANQGTIFLDEIAELPLALQAKLLHVLQDFRCSRVGGPGAARSRQPGDRRHQSDRRGGDCARPVPGGHLR